MKLCIAALAALLLVAASPVASPTFPAVDVPSRYGIPAPEYVLLGAAARGDWRAVRRHAWAVWASLNAPSGVRANGEELPVWQTWYDVPEVFAASPPGETERRFGRELRPLAQTVVGHRAAGGRDATVFGFVKYNRSARDFLRGHALDRAATLATLQARFDARRTPNEWRIIPPFPPDAIVLKAAFWLVPGDRVSAFPYWDPAAPPPAGGRTPNHLTWKRCVAIDPSGALAEGTIRRLACNGGRAVDARVVHLDRFVRYRLATPEDVARVRGFAKDISMHTDQERMVTGALVPHVGDYVVLTAMHVTTKEIAAWTWQSFWWTPDASRPPFGGDQPSFVQGAPRSYAMCEALAMDVPREANGGPHRCFNPYLETDLGPTKPYLDRGRVMPADPMAGTRANCMACHARAGWPAKMDPPFTDAASMGGIANEGYRPPDSPYYAHLVRTDFLWSIPLHARAPHGARSVRSAPR